MKPVRDKKIALRQSAKNRKLNVRIPAPVFQMIDDLAEQNDCTTSEVARAILIEKLLDLKRIDYELRE